jgi:hypothetical protein
MGGIWGKWKSGFDFVLPGLALSQASQLPQVLELITNQ